MTREADPQAESEPQPTAGVGEQQPSTDAQPTDEPPPLLKIINADATPEEIAALVAVFSALGSAAAPARRRTPEWQAHHRKVRPPVIRGPGGWRPSGLPR